MSSRIFIISLKINNELIIWGGIQLAELTIVKNRLRLNIFLHELFQYTPFNSPDRWFEMVQFTSFIYNSLIGSFTNFRLCLKFRFLRRDKFSHDYWLRHPSPVEDVVERCLTHSLFFILVGIFTYR